jgi:tricorn protease
MIRAAPTNHLGESIMTRAHALSLCLRTSTLAVLLIGAPLTVESQPRTPHGGMLHTPDVSASHIVFRYANDLWIVGREGGLASPLASPPGAEGFARFSPDGNTVAFMGNYDGNSDLYTIDIRGGMPARVTHHPGSEVLCDWVGPDELLYHARGVQDYPRASELFRVASDGGLPEKMPVPYGACGTISADGQWLAYTPHTRDHRTWKRYRGGMATDLWLFHLSDQQAQRITDWEGTDSQPMWHGGKLYYLSDAGPEHRLNIWLYDPQSQERRQLTRHEDFDVKWPAIGPGSEGQGEIVFQHAEGLRILDLQSEESRPIDIQVPGDRHLVRPRAVDAAGFMSTLAPSSTGKRVIVEARGDVWSLPATEGSPQNLTRTDGVAERGPEWSPDGKWIAYASDESGSYDLYRLGADGMTPAEKLAEVGAGYLYGVRWSPDSKAIAFWTEAGELHLHDIANRRTTVIDEDPWISLPRVAWSHDSRWLTWARSDASQAARIYLYERATATRHAVTSDMFNDSWPTFDREGKYLFFASNRDFSQPTYEDLGTTWVYAGTDRLYAIPLRADLPSPTAPKNDQEGVANDEAKEAEKEEADPKKRKRKKQARKKQQQAGAAPPLKIDLEGFERRAVALPVDKGSFFGLSVNDVGELVYMRRKPRVSQDKGVVHLLDLEADKHEEKTVVAQADGMRMSADGKKLMVILDGSAAMVDSTPGQKMEERVPTSGMSRVIDPRAEWKQIFTETWRIQRDFFYDPTMHGVDWQAVYDRYLPMLDDCMSRSDLSYVLREMISELNVGHAYYWGGHTESAPSVSVGMLGADFELVNGAYRIKRIVEGADWDVDARGPLSQPGVEVSEGDYLLAVNGAPLDIRKDPWAAFQGLAGQTATITVSASPTIDKKARHLVVKLLGNEGGLRYRAWVEGRRSFVDRATDGRVGYIYVPNTGIQGQNELVRQFHGQTHKEALIIDERWNGGGQIPTRFIELLDRPIANYWARRHGRDWPWPFDAHQGPKCMLINGLAGSGGDYFPFWFRQAGIGKLIGTRTWGGLVGISGNPRLIDGGYTSAPTFAFYETDGTWGIEGHGVDPDIEVIDDPSLMVDGGDPQLEAAIAHMLEELERNPYVVPQRPAYPDRSGMGIPDHDK